jgi:hypothetical protein
MSRVSGERMESIDDEEDLIFTMTDFLKKQAERMRQEKWKYFEEKIKLEKDKYYNFWRRHYFAGEDSGDFPLAD